MLSDQEIARAAAQLADYRRSDALSLLLDQYAVLIDDYKRLKSDYEEEREAREKYKQLSKDQERNPFVLVLVDGDGYVFSDTLLSKRIEGTQADGGNVAAQLLNDEVRLSLRGKGLEHCQIMVRIYANVAGLSTALHRAGVLGSDSRALSPFIASFNRSYGLTEFVDAGPLKENADAKLRAFLRLYADNAQCKHIYFAACHDVGYISELTPFTGKASKFTLVRTPGIRFHDEFTKLGMAIEEFRGGFRHTPLETPAFRANSASSGPRPASGQARSTASPTKQALASGGPATNATQKAVCLFNTLGICKHGKACKDSHDGAPSGSKKAPLLADVSIDAPTHPSQLPKKDDIPAGLVAVNKNNYRIDPQLPVVAPEVMNRLMARVDRRRVCNSFHLSGSCDSGDRCAFDHEPLDDDCLPALESLALSQPCTRRGGCRLDGCTHGHICQNLECRHRGGKVHCRIPFVAHIEPFTNARYVPAVPKGAKNAANGGNGSTGSG